MKRAGSNCIFLNNKISEKYLQKILKNWMPTANLYCASLIRAFAPKKESNIGRTKKSGWLYFAIHYSLSKSNNILFSEFLFGRLLFFAISGISVLEYIWYIYISKAHLLQYLIFYNLKHWVLFSAYILLENFIIISRRYAVLLIKLYINSRNSARVL